MIKSFVFYLFILTLSLQANDSYTLSPIDVEGDREIIDTKDEVYLDREFLRSNQIEDVQGLSGYIPSFSISNYGSRNVSFVSYRGHTNFMTTSSPVALYIDGIPMTYNSTFLAQELFDVNGVSMRKGPQGFDSGLGAQAGTLYLETDNQIPTHTTGSVEMGVANYRDYKAVAHLDAALDGGALKIDALYHERDGFTKNLFDGSSLDDLQTKAVNARYIRPLGDRFRLTLQATLSSNDDGGTPYQSTPEHPFEMEQDINGYVRQDALLGAMRLDYFGDTFDLRSVTTFNDYDSKELLDADRTPEPLAILRSKDRLKEVSQEFAAAYTQDQDTLITGIFLSHQLDRTYDERHDFSYLDVEGYRLWQTSQPEQVAALFGTYERELDRHWHIGLGLRYQVVKKDFDNRFTQAFPIEIPDYGFVNGLDSTLDDTAYWHRLLPKLALTYTHADTGETYLSYAKGFKSGGYSYDDYDVTTAKYEPEDSDTFELGYVSAGRNGLSYTASIYAARVDDLQVETVHADLSSSIDNSAKAEIYGFEAELQYALTEAWGIQSALALTRAKFRKYLSNGIDYSGNHIINVPAYTFFLASDYALNRDFSLHGALRSQGKTYFDKANTLSQSDYLLADLMLSYHHDTLSIDLYFKNLFDRRYFDNVATIGEEFAYNFGEPRRIGMSLRYAFK